MNLPITTPALLFPAIAILMLGYVNRYVSVAHVIRDFRTDYDKGYKHTHLEEQLQILVKRIELLRYMLSVSTIALILACLSMLLIYLGQHQWGETSFGLSIVTMIIGLVYGMGESYLSNKSLIIEVNGMLKRRSKD